MRKLIRVALALILIVLFLNLYQSVGGRKTVAYQNSLSEKADENISKSYSSQTKQFGAVTVTATPKEVSQEGVIIELSLNTHLVELAYDFEKVATLKDDKGNEYKPIFWSGGNGGHHLTGELTFESKIDRAEELELTLNGVDGVSDTFSWQVQ